MPPNPSDREPIATSGTSWTQMHVGNRFSPLHRERIAEILTPIARPQQCVKHLQSTVYQRNRRATTPHLSTALGLSMYRARTMADTCIYPLFTCTGLGALAAACSPLPSVFRHTWLVLIVVGLRGLGHSISRIHIRTHEGLLTNCRGVEGTFLQKFHRHRPLSGGLGTDVLSLLCISLTRGYPS